MAKSHSSACPTRDIAGQSHKEWSISMHVSEVDIEVRYAETDQMGVVHHANYLIWFEMGRTKLVEVLGFSYAQMEAEGYISPVIDIQATYKKPFRFGETARIRTWVEDYDGIRSHYAYEVLNQQGEVCATGTTSHVVLNRDSFRPVSVKRAFPDWHKVYQLEVESSEQ